MMEQVWPNPDIDRILGDKEREITEQSDAFLRSIVSQNHPVSLKANLIHNSPTNLWHILLHGLFDGLWVSVSQGFGPFEPRFFVMRLFEDIVQAPIPGPMCIDTEPITNQLVVWICFE